VQLGVHQHLSEAPIARLAAAAAGVYPSVSDAAQAMVHEKETVQPRPDVHEQYVPLVRLYGKMYPAMHELLHELTDLMEARA
jgi:ribulose kinase